MPLHLVKEAGEPDFLTLSVRFEQATGRLCGLNPTPGLTHHDWACACRQERSESQRHQNKNPHSTGKEIVVGQECGPCGTKNVVTCEELKGYRHRGPPASNQERIA